MTFLKKAKTIQKILEADSTLCVENWNPTRKVGVNSVDDTYKLGVFPSEREELLQLPLEERVKKANRGKQLGIIEEEKRLNKGVDYIHQQLEKTGIEMQVQKAQFVRDEMYHPKISFTEENKTYTPITFKDIEGKTITKQLEHKYTATFEITSYLHLK
jgi:hypothetical protein